MSNLPVSYLHVFPFSPRRGTAAAGYKERVDHETVKARTRELREIGNNKRMDFYRQCIGQTFQVLPEGRHPKFKKFLKGMTDNYIPVLFPGKNALENQFVEVVLENIGDGCITGSRLLHE